MPVKVRCDNCGKEIKLKPSVIKRTKRHFCSRECYNEWKLRSKKIKRICEICGKEFYVIPSRAAKGGGKYCSQKCRVIAATKGIKKVCPICGTEFETVPSQIKRGRGKYCSRSCAGKAARKKRKIPTHHTKPELIFEDICQRNNLQFRYVGDGQLWIGKKNEAQLNPDFIECNGKKIAVEIFSYWHDPLRRYGRVRYSHTYEGRKKILKKYGWKLIVFWQEDLEREDAEAFVLNKLKKEKVISPSPYSVSK